MNNKKRIGIDARLYFQTGVGVYIRNLLHFLQEEAPAHMEFFVYVQSKDESQIQFKSTQFTKREIHIPWHSIVEQTKFHQILKNDTLDLMHFTYFSYPILYKRKFISTVHDLTPLLHKTGRASTLNPWLYEVKYRALKFILKQQMKNATKIITPTETVQKQLIEMYGEKYKEKIETIYEGVNYEIEQAKENIKLKKNFPRPFFLYVGNFYPHKNVGTLVEAYELLDTHDVDLVLVGPDNYFSGLLETGIRSEFKDRIHFYHTGSINDLVFFYKHAIALVNPSISEGFGLPLIEAAFFDLPIIASDLDVFHETFGSQFVSFDPNKPEELQSALQTFIDNPQTFDYSAVKQKYSFRTMAKEILDLYAKQ